VRLEGLGQLKNPVTSSEERQFAIVLQSVPKLTTSVPFAFFSDSGKEKQFLELPVYYTRERVTQAGILKVTFGNSGNCVICRGSSVGTATRLWVGRVKNLGLIPDRLREYCPS
jgi:hypothetical protein